MKAAPAKTPPEKRTKTRGPQFPAVSLKAALEWAKRLWEREKRNAVSLKVLASHWGRSQTSSRFQSLVRTLVNYGLLQMFGSDHRLTPRALTILLRGEAEKAPELKGAALSPRPYQDLWIKYGIDLPSDESLAHKLLQEGYHPLFVPTIISDWRETMAFAGLDREQAVTEYSAPEEEPVTGEEEAEPAEPEPVKPPAPEPVSVIPTAAPAPPAEPAPAPPVAPSAPAAAPVPAEPGRYIRIPLRSCDVEIREGMNAEEYDLLLHSLKVLRERIVG